MKTLKQTAVLIVYLFLLQINVYSQTFEWANHLTGNGEDVILAIESDNIGNQVVVGTFYSSLNLAPPSQSQFYLTSIGFGDIFIAKYDKNGLLLWGKHIGGTNVNGEEAQSIAINSKNEIYITGYFYGLIDFDPGVGVHTLNSNDQDGFLLKLDSNGTFLDVKQFGNNNASGSSGMQILIDNLDDLYLSGTFGGSMNLDFSGSTSFNVQSNNAQDIFIAKYDSALTLKYAIALGGQFDQLPSSITMDENFNLYLGFNFNSIIDADPSQSSYLLTPVGDFDLAVVKFDSIGQFIWAKSFGGNQDDLLSNIIVSDDLLLISGSFKSTVDFDPGPAVNNIISQGGFDMFISKFDLFGNYIQAQIYGAASDQFGGYFNVDKNKTIYIIGNFKGTVDFNPGPATNHFVAGSTEDAYLIKFDSIVNFQNAFQFTSTGFSSINLTCLSFDTCANIYLGGSFIGTVDCDPGNNSYSLNSTTSLADVFFVKLQSNSNCLSVGITEPENSDYSIYPNPTNGIIHLSNLICNENIEIQILNSLGQIQLHQTFTNENAIELHLENYPKGIYFLKYRCGSLCRTEKIILQ